MPLSTTQLHSLRPDSPVPSLPESTRSDTPATPHLEPFTTDPDTFGLYHIYANWPTHIPDESLGSVCNAPGLDGSFPPTCTTDPASMGVPGFEGGCTHVATFAPFTNLTCGNLMAWQYSGTNQKSAAELDWLAQFLAHPLCNPRELTSFHHLHEAKLLDKFLGMNNLFKEEYGWHRSAVMVCLPNEKLKWPSESAAPKVIIDGVWHQDLIDIITSTFQSEQFKTFHTMPFRQCWQVSDDHVIDILSEAYSSLEMLHAHKDINKLPCELDRDLEHVVACLMLWSDSTHLTNFRDMSMWPFYMYFGNQLKYLRGKPTAMACHHVTYIPKVW
ncbi:hypothetical protein M404DRAFT_168535 [Pisolithus tinctorius Marx 270]|uniref:Uncharacterized protein n=1 Tax=Pisolithus tinctorius Marx 270 TaxID=870435 RepID=A0A0C3J9P3_PISTI|nr:hypothetical protein M404DRAFT_168535 [Pisolithus tinctorius Marx 270]